MSSLTTPEAELRALGSLRRQCLFAVTILLVEDSRSASEAIRLYAAESGARVRRADSLHAASRHLAIYRPSVVMVDLGLPDGDGHGADPPPRLGLDAARRHRRAERARARRLAGRGDAGRRGRLPREADREPARLPGMRALGAAGRREPPRPDERELSPRRRAPRWGAALDEDLRRARALLTEAIPAATPKPSPIARSSSARSARCSATVTSSRAPAIRELPGVPRGSRRCSTGGSGGSERSGRWPRRWPRRRRALGRAWSGRVRGSISRNATARRSRRRARR